MQALQKFNGQCKVWIAACSGTESTEGGGCF